MPNYQNGKIYKLVSNISNDIYIGSTVNNLSHRLNKHKDKNNTCVSKQLFANDAIIKIILIEMFPCSSKIELKAREHHYITTLMCINKHIPFITDIVIVNGNIKEWSKAYKTEHVEHFKEYSKKYNQANKEHIKEYYKKYNQANKDKTNERNNLYNEANKERLKEYGKAYRKANTEHIKEYNKEYYKASKNKNIQ